VLLLNTYFKKCPAGFIQAGETCHKPSYNELGFSNNKEGHTEWCENLWYHPCKEGFKRGRWKCECVSSQDCPDGMKEVNGSSCKYLDPPIKRESKKLTCPSG
jgi:hypothetical protein